MRKVLTLGAVNVLKYVFNPLKSKNNQDIGDPYLSVVLLYS
jgi:hypothetical protein